MVTAFDPGNMRSVVTFFRRRAPAPGATNKPGKGKEQWDEVCTVRAEVQDVLPSRAQRDSDVATASARPARLRMLYRTDITADMRVVHDRRTYEIVTGPAQLGFRQRLELVIEETSAHEGGK